MSDSGRPNILWIIADQLRADHVGFGGNTIVRTPNLDALAARGTVFDRAYVANPICMPNRCSMLTGRMPSAHGVVFNDRSLSWNANTCVRELVKSGYSSTLVGKSHIQHGLSRNVVQDSVQAPTCASVFAPGWDTLEDADRYLAGVPEISDFYGFEHVEFALGHGDAVTGHHYLWAIERGGDPVGLIRDWLGPGPAHERYDGWWQVYQPTLPEELHSTTFVTERTIDALQRHAVGDRPFFLQCSFPDPHHPFTPPGKWWKAYDPAAMPDPVTFDDPLEHAPAHLRRIRSWKPSRNMVQMFGATREQVRHARAAEYGMIEMMDDGIGKVLRSLDALGLSDNTIIVFTSDHGDMFGDHGLMLKATMHYQGCLRVPLVIARPHEQGHRTASLASSMDLAQTFLDLAGVAPFADMQGHSLLPLLDGEVPVRSHVIVEEDFVLARAGGPLPVRTRTLVTDRYRYSRYSSAESELYDLVDDPDELHNLAADNARSSLLQELQERMLDGMAELSPMSVSG